MHLYKNSVISLLPLQQNRQASLEKLVGTWEDQAGRPPCPGNIIAEWLVDG